MSSSTIDSTQAPTAASSTHPAHATGHHTTRAWLVLVALVAVATLGLTLLGRAAAGASTDAAPVTAVAPSAPGVPALSEGAWLLASAWDLAQPAQRAQVCAQFAADPDAAWTAYSGAAQTVATRAEFSAFLDATC